MSQASITREFLHSRVWAQLWLPSPHLHHRAALTRHLSQAGFLKRNSSERHGHRLAFGWGEGRLHPRNPISPPPPYSVFSECCGILFQLFCLRGYTKEPSSSSAFLGRHSVSPPAAPLSRCCRVPVGLPPRRFLPNHAGLQLISSWGSECGNTESPGERTHLTPHAKG